MRHKGQVSGIDLALALALVVFILFSVMEVWSSLVIKLSDYTAGKTAENKLLDVSELLSKTPGDPPNWHRMAQINPSNVKTIGFALQDNDLDPARIEKASSIEYDSLKEMLGLSREEIYITVTDLQSSDRTVLYSMGRFPEGTVATSSRYATLNNTLVELKVSMYYSNSTYMSM